MAFAPHPNIAATSILIAELGLCQARLQDDARFDWIVLIPRLAGAVELDDLGYAQRSWLMDEIAAASAAVRALGEAQGRPVEKINVAALGNVTPQLHVHVLGRRRDDGLWPDPVWGRGTAVPLAERERDPLVARAARALAAG